MATHYLNVLEFFAGFSYRVHTVSDRRMEIGIEYLIAKDTLKWITLFTEQAILISMCLQVGSIYSETRLTRPRITRKLA